MSRDVLIDAARAFDEAALRLNDDNAQSKPVRKWTGPIRLAFQNGHLNPDLVGRTRQAIGALAEHTRAIAVVDTGQDDPSANYVVRFDENESVSGKRNCYARAWWTSWVIGRAELKINPASPAIDACIVHEAMHSFGFLAHPHGSDSILSYVYRRRALMPLDLHLIPTLYDPRMTPGLEPAPASQLACRILGGRLGAAPRDIDAVCRDRKGPTPGD